LDELGPLASAIGKSSRDEHETADEAKVAYLAAMEQETPGTPVLSIAEFTKRLGEIDWHRYRKHWIAITGSKVDKNGNKKTRRIKDGKSGQKTIVEAQAQNTAAVINSVVNKMLSDSWTDLTSDVDAK
jgi:hypothetical protein